jgi:hypothetical protein
MEKPKKTISCSYHDRLMQTIGALNALLRSISTKVMKNLATGCLMIKPAHQICVNACKKNNNQAPKA